MRVPYLYHKLFPLNSQVEETCHELLSQALDGCNASYGLLLLLPLADRD